MTRSQVCVVGGGLAGITAALAAADAGFDVTLVERRQRLGGLTWSFSRNGRSFDNGQHVFLRCCDRYLALLDRIGSAGGVTIQSRLDVPVVKPGGARAHIRRNGLPAPLHLAAALARYRHLGISDRIRLAAAAGPLRFLDPEDPALDGVTFGDWLARHHQRPAAVEALWNLIVLPTVNLPAHEASLAAAAKVFRTGLLDRADAGDIGWATVPLGELHDAAGRSALRAAGVRVLLGCRARALHPEGGGGEGEGGGGWSVITDAEEVAAHHVVVALPPAAAAEVAPAGSGPDPASLGSSPIVNVHLVYDRKVTDLPLAAAVGSPVQFVFDRTEPAGMVAGEQHLAVSLSAAQHAVRERPEALIDQFHHALGDLFPAARRASLVDAVVTKEHQATFRAAPGALRHRLPTQSTLPGLLWAGSWTDTGWPATMEGAVRSGLAAAAALQQPPAARPAPQHALVHPGAAPTAQEATS